MSDVHPGPGREPHQRLCKWTSNYQDVFLSCDDPAIPSVGYCAEHFVQLAERRAERGIEPIP